MEKKPPISEEKELTVLDKDLLKLDDFAVKSAGKEISQPLAQQGIEGQILRLDGVELVNAAREERKEDFFARLNGLIPGLDTEQQKAAYNACSIFYFQHQGRLMNRKAGEAIAKGDTAAAKYWVEKSAENARRREGLGETNAQVKNLYEIGQGLNPKQREDMLRAALGSGYSAAAVFATVREWERSRKSAGEKSGEVETTAELIMQKEATHLMRERLDDLRQSLDDIRREGESEERRKKAIEAETKLAHLVGTSHATDARKMLSRHGAEIEDTIASDLAHALEVSKVLHSGGRLKEVVAMPRTEGPIKK